VSKPARVKVDLPFEASHEITAQGARDTTTGDVGVLLSVAVVGDTRRFLVNKQTALFLVDQLHAAIASLPGLTRKKDKVAP
jgi:hypothetical protein